MYVHLVDATNSSEDIEQLPVIRIINNSTNDYEFRGLEQIGLAILGIVPYLGGEPSEFVPFAVELWDGEELTLANAGRERRRRRRRQEDN